MPNVGGDQVIAHCQTDPLTRTNEYSIRYLRQINDIDFQMMDVVGERYQAFRENKFRMMKENVLEIFLLLCYLIYNFFFLKKT